MPSFICSVFTLGGRPVHAGTLVRVPAVPCTTLVLPPPSLQRAERYPEGLGCLRPTTPWDYSRQWTVCKQKSSQEVPCSHAQPREDLLLGPCPVVCRFQKDAVASWHVETPHLPTCVISQTNPPFGTDEPWFQTLTEQRSWVRPQH